MDGYNAWLGCQLAGEFQPRASASGKEIKFDVVADYDVGKVGW